MLPWTCVPKVLCGQTLSFLSGARPEVELPGLRSALEEPPGSASLPAACEAPVTPQPRQRVGGALLARGHPREWGAAATGLNLWAEAAAVALGGFRCPGAIRAQHRWAQDSFIVAVSSIGLCRPGKSLERGSGAEWCGKEGCPGIRSRETSGNH